MIVASKRSIQYTCDNYLSQYIKPNKNYIGHFNTVEYFPVYSLFTAKDRDLYYKIEKPTNRKSLRKIDYNNILYNLIGNAPGNTVDQFKIEGVTYNLYTQFGFLYDDERTLLMLTTNDAENMFTPDGKNIYPEKLRLYVSIEFMTDIIYKNVYARIYKEYIQECFNIGVEVIYTTSEKIDKYVFANPYVKNIVDIPTLMENINEEGFNLLTFVEPVEVVEEEIPF